VRAVWDLAAKQHGVVARKQLLDLGVHPQAIKHRVAKGRLHPVHHGVYAVGRPALTRTGRWMAAVLRCGRGAALSHASAAALHGIAIPEVHGTEISVPMPRGPRVPGVRVHRRRDLTAADLTRVDGIPVTTPLWTLLDLAGRLPRSRLEAAINEVTKLGLTDPDDLRSALTSFSRRPGTVRLREVLDRHTFTLTDSVLERRFLPLARAAGLPLPQTGQLVNGFKVDFYWPELGLVVETDGLRYHRTPAQQARDRQRDQAHAIAGLTSLRFTHAQVWHQPRQVQRTLVRVADRLRKPGDPSRR
jgi:very-short-patch-repair endonuclease